MLDGLVLRILPEADLAHLADHRPRVLENVLQLIRFVNISLSHISLIEEAAARHELLLLVVDMVLFDERRQRGTQFVGDEVDVLRLELCL